MAGGQKPHQEEGSNRHLLDVVGTGIAPAGMDPFSIGCKFLFEISTFCCKSLM